MLDDDIDEKPEVRELTADQRRVLGVLLEKAFTTPEYYPMTLKGLVAGCSQKSNRSPVCSYDEDRIEDTLEELKDLGLVVFVIPDSGRAERYRHFMRKRYSFSEPQLAILTELLLRGRQTLGELRARASRMVTIEDLKTLRTELQDLLERGYVQASGSLERRGIEVDHAFYRSSETASRLGISVEVNPDPPSHPTSAQTSLAENSLGTRNDFSDSNPTRHVTGGDDLVLKKLKSEIDELREQNRELQRVVGQLQSEFDDFRHRIGDM